MRTQRMTRRAAAVLTTALLIAAAALLPSGSALAHGGESEEARLLVLQALAYLANEPDDYLEVVEDKVSDALESPDTEGVDLSKVESAQDALDAGDLGQVRTDLQAAVLPLTEPVKGEETGTTTMLDPLTGPGEWSGADGVLAGLSALALIAGVLLAVWSRPKESLAELRRDIQDGGTGEGSRR